MSIPLSKDIDLGGDRIRMSDCRDVERQTVTAQAILDRFFATRERGRTELQVLADEVGMGKTFVALATAYSILEAMRDGRAPDLNGCYQKILILTPDNDALFKKWAREASEFVGRCVRPKSGGDERVNFRALPCSRLDEFIRALRKPHGESILILKTGRLRLGKIQHRAVKLRRMFSALCRYWAKRLVCEDRDRLLKGAPEGWPTTWADVGRFETWEEEDLLFEEDDFLDIFARFEGREGKTQALMGRALECARDLGAPYRRERADGFVRLEAALAELYGAAVFELIKSELPLVVVDEAHNWKNGPSQGANAFEEFSEHIAPRARRLLMLSATPFQLRPQEMLELFKAGDTLALPANRLQQLKQLRETILQPALEQSVKASKRFGRIWAELPPSTSPKEVEEAWTSSSLRAARQELEREAESETLLDEAGVDLIAKRAVRSLPTGLRGFIQAALQLFACNRTLSLRLGRLVIRHRRTTDHRLVRVGAELLAPRLVLAKRPDRSSLHVGPGLEVKGDAELPHYLLMRAVSEMKEGRGRAALGSALTGSYSTLLDSSEGRLLRTAIETGKGAMYLKLLAGMVGEEQDPAHPKVAALVSRVVSAWERGEKYLIFCFRIHTARRLREIIREAIQGKIAERRLKLLKTPTAFENLKKRLTAREQDLIPLALDRVLWSWGLSRVANGQPFPFRIDDLRPHPDDFKGVAECALRFGIDFQGEQVDRVFLHRAFEHSVALRLLRGTVEGDTRKLLSRMAEVAWVERPLGVDVKHEDDEGDAALTLQRRGVHKIYAQRSTPPSPQEIEELAGLLWEREKNASRTGHSGLLEGVAESANLWLGPDPATSAGPAHPEAVLRLHRFLWDVTLEGDDEAWEARLHLMAALRRAVLRESTLVRLLPEPEEREKDAWGTLLAKALLAPMPGQQESFLSRLAVFLEDYKGSSGSLREGASLRAALIDSTLLRDDSLVSLVDGGTGQDQRDRIFSGFNTPLLPDVLICTSVGQEGIDLHRNCRHVVHYDLPWNPATLEQRTGRVDRIGSKTFRERKLEEREKRELSVLDVAVPYLAGTYDERIYEELRLRAQTFEVLTGGHVSADRAEGVDENGQDDEGAGSQQTVIALPPALALNLRVRLEIVQPSELSS